MKNKDITRVNQVFYDQVYGGQSTLLHLIHAYVSFDQQSKSKPNWVFLKKHQNSILSGQSGVKLLDYGCGWGSFILKLPRDVEPFFYDVSHNATLMLERVMSLRGRKPHAIHDDPQNTKNTSMFDIIVCSHVLEHVEDESDLLALFSDMLAPRGRVLINVPINEAWDDPRHCRAYDSESLGTALNKAGIDITDEWQVDKWTGFLLEQELNPKNISLPAKYFLRLLRLLLAVLPYRLVQWSERRLFPKRPYNQLLVFGRKAS